MSLEVKANKFIWLLTFSKGKDFKTGKGSFYFLIKSNSYSTDFKNENAFAVVPLNVILA